MQYGEGNIASCRSFQVMEHRPARWGTQAFHKSVGNFPRAVPHPKCRSATGTAWWDRGDTS